MDDQFRGILEVRSEIADLEDLLEQCREVGTPLGVFVALLIAVPAITGRRWRIKLLERGWLSDPRDTKEGR